MEHLKISSMLIGLISVTILSLPCFGSITYSGSLQYTPPAPAGTTDGINVLGPSGQWDNYTVTFSWTVTNSDTSYPSYPWKYTYRMQLSGTQYGYSHIIIESSDDMTSSDIFGLTGAVLDSVKLQTVQGGNPDMPEDVYGIRFNPPTSGITDLTWSFYSNREPVWGDFYARCGGFQGGINQAYNYNMDEFGVASGFLDPDGDNTNLDDIDPTSPASNNSVNFHILRPDTVVIPAPGAVFLVSIGAGLAGWLKRRRVL